MDNHVNVGSDPAYNQRAFSILVEEDDAEIRVHPLTAVHPIRTIHSGLLYGKLEVSTVLHTVENETISRKQNCVRIIILYGSMRSRCAKASRKASDASVIEDPTPDF
ncbi:unnamed protein product [Clonostachys rosea f. rosea IK726]|uniref:Uncharacterized protein n=2 Tax=Bionectria ochroleuca TaxID=29856 RepID=A0A0B7K165_BIOOC|nr:unnamed protein product [Clonostachys rosea f. rosea IK726]